MLYWITARARTRARAHAHARVGWRGPGRRGRSQRGARRATSHEKASLGEPPLYGVSYILRPGLAALLGEHGTNMGQAWDVSHVLVGGLVLARVGAEPPAGVGGAALGGGVGHAGEGLAHGVVAGAELEGDLAAGELAPAGEEAAYA